MMLRDRDLFVVAAFGRRLAHDRCDGCRHICLDHAEIEAARAAGTRDLQQQLIGAGVKLQRDVVLVSGCGPLLTLSEYLFAVVPHAQSVFAAERHDQWHSPRRLDRTIEIRCAAITWQVDYGTVAPFGMRCPAQRTVGKRGRQIDAALRTERGIERLLEAVRREWAQRLPCARLRRMRELLAGLRFPRHLRVIEVRMFAYRACCATLPICMSSSASCFSWSAVGTGTGGPGSATACSCTSAKKAAKL